MLKSNRAIVIHTRKEVIAIFEELKNRINSAYESQTEQSFYNLLTVLKVIFYLHPVHKFISEINSIGTIPVTVFLENLLIKANMIKLNIAKPLRNWVITLLLQFKALIPELDIEGVKQLKSKKYEIYNEWDEENIVAFVVKDLQQAIQRRDVGIIALFVYFLRVFILHQEYNKQIFIESQSSKWRHLISSIVEATLILDDLKKQETSICICYYLCLKQKSLSQAAIQSGILDYLVNTLTRQFVALSFGKKIIEFIKYLLLHLDSKYLQQISIQVFEKALALFSSRFSKEEIITSIRDLVSILEQKVSAIDYQHKLDQLAGIYEQFRSHMVEPQKFYQMLHIINLYIHNDRMGNLMVKYYPSLFYPILHEQHDPQVIKISSGFMAYHFKKGKFGQQVAVHVINKVKEVITSGVVRETLLLDRKHLLIELVRIVKLMLENREHQNALVQVIRDGQLQQRLWQFSDCTNYIYERQLLQLRQMLGDHDLEHKQKEIEILQQLQAEIINKSRFNINKLSWELFEEVKFLENLLNQKGELHGYKPSEQIPIVVSNYIQTANLKAIFTLLQNIDNQESQQLRKEFNFVCCKLLSKILKANKKDTQETAHIKNKIIALTTSQDQIDDIYDIVNNFFVHEEQLQVQHERRQSCLRQSLRLQQENAIQAEFTLSIRTLLHQYFRNESTFDITLVKINSLTDLSIVMEQLAPYQNQTDILKYLKVVLELVQKDIVCGNIYKMLSSKLFEIYQALIARKGPFDSEVIQTIDRIVLKFVKFHRKNLFYDIYDPDTVNYYLLFVAEIDSHFQFGFTHKRIQLLEVIIEYLECNMIEIQNQYEKLIKKEDRSEFIRSYIDINKPQAIGISYAKLLSLNSDDEVHETFWMQHKEHIMRGLYQNSENTPYLKFIQVYIAECQRFIYKEYQLQNLIEAAIELFIKECNQHQHIINNAPNGVLKLRKIKYFAAVHFAYGEREDFKSNKNILYSQEEGIVKALLMLLECSQATPSESFKKFYIEQIIVTLLKTLTKLYRLNFIDKEIRSEQLSKYFDRFMQISNEDAINCVCQLMRSFLLKKFLSMAQCPALESCEQYIESLPALGQQHIKACMRIENLLGLDQSLEEESKLYFAHGGESNEEQEEADLDYEKFAHNMMRNSAQQKPIASNGSIRLVEQIDKERPKQIDQTQTFKVGQDQTIKRLQVAWTQSQLLEYLRNVMKSPSNYSIKHIAQRLLQLQNIEYYYLLIDLFLNSEELYRKDTNDSVLPLEEVQQAIVLHLPVNVCPLDSRYYEVLQKNVVGAGICLRKKGGMKATEILGKKLIQSQEKNRSLRLMHCLTKNIGSNNELKYLNNIKIYDILNGHIAEFATKEADLRIICEFIAATAQNPTLRSHYQVSYALAKILTESEFQLETKLSIIKALTILSTDSRKPQQIIYKTSIMTYLIELLKDQTTEKALLIPSSHFLANLTNYYESPSAFSTLGLEELILNLINHETKKQTFSLLIINCLRVLEVLTKHSQSAAKILKGNFAYMLLPICRLALVHSNLDAVGLEVTILRQIIVQLKPNLQKTLVDLQAGGMIEFLVQASVVVSKLKKTQCFLEVICQTFTIREMVVRCMGANKQILRIMVEILKHGEHEMLIVEKWTKIISQLFECSKFLYFSDILKTNLFYLAASCLKHINFITQVTMDLSLKLMKQLNAIQDPENLLIRHGFASYMIQILRMKNIQTNDYLALLTMLKKLQEKTIFPPHLSTKLFEIVIKHLQHHWHDQLAIKSIILLKKIKKNVEITTQFSHSLFQFFNKFLVQCGKCSGNYQFYSISREIICLISYYINFNEDIKLLFRSQAVINVLRNWVKIYKSVAEEQSSQTFLLWMYSAFSHQSLLYDVCSISSTRLLEIQARFEKGWKVNLFRLNGSYKSALFRYDKSKQQIVAFKFPDGEIKAKYRLPLKNIQLVHQYQSDRDFLFDESRFTRTINPFQHTVNFRHCLTIFSLMEERSEVRQLSLQVLSLQEVQEIYYNLKILLNKMYEKQREEEVKVWIAKSSKEIPINSIGV